jgi:hypothetical protein
MKRYEIQVTGQLGSRRVRRLGCEGVLVIDGSASVLAFEAVDQAALYGLLARLRDLGLELVAVRRSSPDDRAAPSQAHSSTGGA